MTGRVRALPAVLGFLLALAVLSGTAFWAQQRVLDPARTRSADATAEPLVAAVPEVAAPEEAPGRAATGSRGGVRAGSGVPAVDPTWAATTADRSGIPAPAVAAYGRATLMAPDGCSVGWTTLAGIGWVESQHGTIDGRALGEDGHSSSPVLGPALDGRGKVAAIPATPSSSRWHGDPDWDHAVGPLQFIPSTWRRWSADGDGDGTEDPNDLDDAALAAVRYLCADGHDLTTGEGWSAAIFSYNHAQEYVAAVHAAATAYAERTG
ncbi:lytic transglycosylase domain-containing protein [Nocardioides sp. Arc9.136]|uniref:lytic transglycosylase domain-containing protein n=1 Tax=Nocardioides sp. Arc9.136 TaxID=2996826 RepID=UPI0026662448|nr:lytic murein transglycosylase [Nocardioides sp. Arc9.136]WKN48720.1 lytic murein transglycosylase [Nocardioides sp. Arc9.136]